MTVLPLSTDHAEFLRDESRRVGNAESISFPQTEAEVKEILAALSKTDIPITVQGGRTGITAGAVPYGGHVLNLSRMKGFAGLRKTGDTFYLSVRPGTLLSEVREALSRMDFSFDPDSESQAVVGSMKAAGAQFFPPDPTETSATIGGMLACNASGACSFHYGPTRRYVQSLRVVTANGDSFRLERGVHKSQGRDFEIQTDSGATVSGTFPAYNVPRVKNAAGYFVGEDVDLVDLFIGSDGTLGVITEVEVRLIPFPQSIWGLMAFFPTQQEAIGFVKAVRTDHAPVAIEFFNNNALSHLRATKETRSSFGNVPSPPGAPESAVYVEFHGNDDDAVSECVFAASEVMMEFGGTEEATWVASDARELERLKSFRHAIPESVNMLIDERRKTEPNLTKLGTDMSVPDDFLEEVLKMYDEDLAQANLESVIFGHIGDNHLHVNVLPRNMGEYDQGKALYLKWAEEVVRFGGSVSAEHGVGKLKTELLKKMYGAKAIEQMKALKYLFDPNWRLSPGNLFG